MTKAFFARESSGGAKESSRGTNEGSEGAKQNGEDPVNGVDVVPVTTNPLESRPKLITGAPKEDGCEHGMHPRELGCNWNPV